MRKNAFTLLIGLLSLILTACGPAVQPADDDPCAEGETYCGADTDGVDICVDVSSNASHCGSCHNECRGPEANACMDSFCACVGGDNVSDACDGDTACAGETGQCILPDYGTDERCDPVEGIVCEDTNKVCADSFCTVPDCNHIEVCDGLDNDCDGHLDATGPLPGQGAPLMQSCYNGPDGTEDSGICRPGVHVCLGGMFTQSCQGEQTPVSEDGILRCDGLDNDCDTCADDAWNEEGECELLPPLEADIVFVIDRSGSMTSTIAAVVSAVQSWATDIGTNPNIRFALVDPTDPGGVLVTQALTDYAAFNNVMSGVAADGSGVEPMHYATQLVLSDNDFETALGFTTGAIRIVIAIHDESAILGGNAVPGYSEATVCGAVPSNTILAVITYAQWYTDWDLCTSSTDVPPTAMELTSDPAAMLANLNLIIETPCF